MQQQVKKLLTCGLIAKQHGLELHQVQHAIDSRKIVPVSRAGTLRVFSEEQAEEIARIANAIVRRRRAS